MRKTVWIICGTLIVCTIVFSLGYLQGRRAGTGFMDTITAGYTSHVEQLERDIVEARRTSELVRTGIIAAKESVDSGTIRLEESLSSITRLGSVTAQIRGLAQAIRDHVETLRATAEILENVNNNLISN